MKKMITLGVLLFTVCCLGTAGWIFVTDGPTSAPCILLQQTTTTTDPPVEPTTPTEPAQLIAAPASAQYNAQGGAQQILTLGSSDPESDYYLALELTTLGAAVRNAVFSRFDNRDPQDPQPLVFLSPVPFKGDRMLYSFANQGLVLVGPKLKLSLDRLDWALVDQSSDPNGVLKSATFEVSVTDERAQPVLQLRKTYRVNPKTYLLDCDLSVENLSDAAHEFYLGMTGPVGPVQEGFRQDMRKSFAAYRDSKAQIRITARPANKLKKASSLADRELGPAATPSHFQWTALVNKYFAAIVVPEFSLDPNAAPWLRNPVANYLLTPTPEEPDRNTLGLSLTTQAVNLAAKTRQDYRFQIFLGPKDKGLFDKIPFYDQLGFAYVIDFIGCCCPAALIRPLAFFIMGLMNTMYAVIPNYGIVIIILVFLMRLVLHPVTKKSQLSMHKMSKLAPRAEEIKKKYANNKNEMNKQLMELYREQGASPIMGFLPMLLQMPIWISLWSAVNSSINLRGASFLPFWITDLSVPDHLFRFPGFELPFIGAYFNLLPLLMGVAFYLQQKLMPTQQNAAANPQMAQQQKMMMIMLPIMFPVMMYSVPSGVNLYIMTSTFAGVLEQHVIRKHIKEKEAIESIGRVAVTSKTGGKLKKKKPKPMFKNMR
jgi:YidC/Oxa1 family membrane protein insertase